MTQVPIPGRPMSEGSVLTPRDESLVTPEWQQWHAELTRLEQRRDAARYGLDEAYRAIAYHFANRNAYIAYRRALREAREPDTRGEAPK